MVAVGHQTEEQRTAIEGWWRVYSGMCEVLVDVAFLKGSYFVHAESNPRSTMPDDAFSWGDEEPLCVKFLILGHLTLINVGVTISLSRLLK